MKRLSMLLVCAILLGLVSCKEDYPDLKDGLYAEFNTNKGSFIAELYYKATPTTVANFVSLAEGDSHKMVDSTAKGKKYYDGLIFHRVIKDFMIQGGDPTGTGSGDPGYRFPDEIVDTLSHTSKGTLSMANAGPGTNGSQFFITLAPTPWLDGKHTIFGEVMEGQAVVDSIGMVKTVASDKPEQDVVLESVKIIQKGKDAKDFKAAKTFESNLADAKVKEEEVEAARSEMKKENTSKFMALKEEAKELESGIKIHYLEKGEDVKIPEGSMVMVNYAGYFEDGTLFDTSWQDVAEQNGALNIAKRDQGGYQPMPTKYGPDAPMIPGFRDGIAAMNVGDRALVFIPSHLGYGERGAGGVIPPNTDLIFEIEIVEIQK
ncbi:peptidylprolyl isomerase [Gillisia hiemivivida]|uniref:peptidylprolyl isomerase n=1 Tax=Gillisia hiemivivida TaxID=291190 RepID=A0A5C6ZSI3_9FLAO|nr:peptidylprolyl isomerase [Gillisia hiemivivida]TXD93290.1 peptidylprolyl isomerase [Gillisia hiemivivida]